MIKKIDIETGLYGLKIIKMDEYGECLFTSDHYGNIRMFSQ